MTRVHPANRPWTAIFFKPEQADQKKDDYFLFPLTVNVAH